MRLVASEDGRDASVTIHQDARLYAAILDAGGVVEHTLSQSRYAWLQVARGTVKLNELDLKQGDGAAVKDETDLKLVAQEAAEILLFDLA